MWHSTCAVTAFLLLLHGEAVLPLGRLRARCFRGKRWKKTKELILNLLAIMNRYEEVDTAICVNYNLNEILILTIEVPSGTERLSSWEESLPNAIPSPWIIAGLEASMTLLGTMEWGF